MNSEADRKINIKRLTTASQSKADIISNTAKPKYTLISLPRKYAHIELSVKKKS